MMKDINSESPDRSTIEAFAKLMGSDAPYYYTMVPRKDKKGKKVEGHYSDVMQAPEFDDWENHLKGGTALSIILNCADDDGMLNMVRRITVDSDDYGLCAEEICRRSKEQAIACQVTRSKSGGGHVHLFFREKIPASRGRRIGFQIAAALDLQECEVFPKQEEVDAVGRKGNGMNVPYYGDDRWGVKLGPDGEPSTMTLGEFNAGAEAVALSPDEIAELEKRLPEPKKQETRTPDREDYLRAAKLNQEVQQFYNGPPCLQTLVANGQQVGSHRNDFLYNVGVFHRFVDPLIEQDAMTDALMTANNRYCDPPLKTNEVTSTARSVVKSGDKASFKCKDEPICSVCVRDTCKSRLFGVALRGMSLPFRATIYLPSNETRKLSGDLQMRLELTFDPGDGLDQTLVFRSLRDPGLNLAALQDTLSALGSQPLLDGVDKAQWASMKSAIFASAERVEGGIENEALEHEGVVAQKLMDFLRQAQRVRSAAAAYSERGTYVLWFPKRGDRDGPYRCVLRHSFLRYCSEEGERVSRENAIEGLRKLLERSQSSPDPVVKEESQQVDVPAQKERPEVRRLEVHYEALNRFLQSDFVERDEASDDEEDPDVTDDEVSNVVSKARRRTE